MRKTEMYELLSFKKSIDMTLRKKYGHFTGRQLLIFDAVASGDGTATLTEVAQANQCSTQAARAFVNGLRDRGYLVVFEPTDGDMRRIDIALTDKGRKLAQACPVEDIADEFTRSDKNPEVLLANVALFFEHWASAAVMQE